MCLRPADDNDDLTSIPVPRGACYEEAADAWRATEIHDRCRDTPPAEESSVGGALAPVVGDTIDPAFLAALRAELPRICELLLLRTGHSFHSYKSPALAHGILRRMLRVGAFSVGDYRALLEENEQESQALLSNLLIGSTAFFRDPESWAALAKALELKVAAMAEGSVLRAWVPACSTGQDAFSTAIILEEIAMKTGRRIRPRLCATDINQEALEVGRHAHYPVTIAREVSQDRLRNFFTVEGGGYRLCTAVRDRVFFGEQNVITDPPISSLHLIVCRNFLIYLDAAERARVLSIFHHALHPGGILFTGFAEMSEGTKPFSSMDRKHPVYARLDAARPPSPWTRSALRDAARRTNAATAAVSATLPPVATTPQSEPDAGKSGIVREVRRRLRSTRTHALPELRVTDNELRSAIEELVSTNEQLETSREQVYTLNEELSVVNAALEEQVDALQSACDDLNSLLHAADVAAIIVTCDLTIVRFTTAIVSFIPLRSTDIGRPLGDIAHVLRYKGLLGIAQEVVRTLETMELCSTISGVSVLVRLSPYRTTENLISGVVITFTDITKLVAHLANQ